LCSGSSVSIGVGPGGLPGSVSRRGHISINLLGHR
jgi:hypothetical protein